MGLAQGLGKGRRVLILRPLLSLIEAAQILGVKEDTMRRLAGEVIPAVVIKGRGGKRRQHRTLKIRPEAIEAYLKANTVGGSPEVLAALAEIEATDRDAIVRAAEEPIILATKTEATSTESEEVAS